MVNRWNAEASWAQRVSFAHALIGWTKGTGLMGHNDAIVGAVEEAGVTTYTTAEMAAMLLDLCTVEAKVAAAHAPLKVDLTGGLGDIELDMAELAAKAREEMTGESDASDDAPAAGTIAALPSPPRGHRPAPAPDWADLDVDPADLVVIVGGAELGPYGSSRTRFEMEVDNELSAAGVLELAWTTGLIKWEDDPKPGWYDTAGGELVDEADLVERYHDVVVERAASGSSSTTGPSERSRLAAAGQRLPRQGLQLRGVLGGRGPRVRGGRSGAHRRAAGSPTRRTGR